MVKIKGQTFAYYRVYLRDLICIMVYKIKIWEPKVNLMNEAKKKDMDKTFRAFKMITWLYPAHHIEKWLNADYKLGLYISWLLITN